MIGVLTAMSVIQGGPGMPIFSPGIFEYLVTGQYLTRGVCDDDVPDPEVQTLLLEVTNCMSVVNKVT